MPFEELRQRPARAAEPIEPPTPAEAPAQPQPDPWKRVRKVALRQLERFISLEPKVLRGDDPEAIHDLRVASRRLQQALDLLYPAPRQGEIRKLRRRIRRARRALGEVRNCDVQLQRVSRLLANKRTARRTAWEGVHTYLTERRAKGFSKAVHRISRLNLAVFYIRLRNVLVPSEHFPSRHVQIEQPEPGQFHARLTASLQPVWQAFQTQVEESRGDTRAGVIHGVRIAAKRLRYLLEIVHEFKLPGSKDTLAWLRDLQEHLGDWHDLEVLEQMMIEMLARQDFLREHLELAMEVEKLIAKNRKGKARFRQRYFDMTMDSASFQEVKRWIESVMLEASWAEEGV